MEPSVLSVILVFSIPIVAIIMAGAVKITREVIRHRERMAKIEMGMDPMPRRGRMMTR